MPLQEKSAKSKVCENYLVAATVDKNVVRLDVEALIDRKYSTARTILLRAKPLVSLGARPPSFRKSAYVHIARGVAKAKKSAMGSQPVLETVTMYFGLPP